MVLAFWIGCALAAAGGVAPLVFGGTSTRIAGAVIPFAIAAGVLALNALMHHQGRGLPTLLYFVAGSAVVYGILGMIAVPVQLAVAGSCPSSPGACEPSLTPGESNGLAAGVLFGLLAIAAGFVGLVLLYRLNPKTKTKTSAPTAGPAARVRPPMAAKDMASESEPIAAAAIAAAPPETPAKPATDMAAPEATAEPELPAGLSESAPPLELAAPEPVLELAPPEPVVGLPALEPEAPPTGTTASTPVTAAPSAPAEARKRRARHTRKTLSRAPADAATETPPEAASEPPQTEPPTSQSGRP